MAVQTVIKHRRDTAANWTSTNPILAAGELGLETDTSKFKFGNGTSTWTALGYSTPDYTSSVQHAVKAGIALTKGQAVYVSSANGTNMIVSKASNGAEATSSKTIGLITSTLSLNDVGNVISEGLLAGLDTSTATAGDPVWLGTSGNLLYGLSNKPVAPAHLVFIGIVTRVHASNGEIFVKVQNGFELEELHNVLISSASNKQVLQYDSATSLWKNATISAGAAVGDTPPSNPSANDIWWDSVGGRAYIYYDSFWVELSPGVVGPQGPAGPTGATGATGPEGPAVTSMNASAVVTTSQDKSANYTLQASDKNTFIRSTNSAITITVPDVLANGESVQFIQAGSGQITFAGSGITLNSADALLKTAKQFAAATVVKSGGAYYLIGNLG